MTIPEWSTSTRHIGLPRYAISGGLRPGTSEFFHVAYRRDERVSGLVSYRIRDGSVLAIFLLGEDSEVEAELWRYCFGIDLMSEIEGFNRPTDDPLPWRLEDPRRLERSTHDQLWATADRRRSRTRIAFVRYARRVDARRPRLFLRVERGCLCSGSGAERRCPVDEWVVPDIELTAAELAAVYLGGVSFDTLVKAGRVRARSAKILETADRMFRTQARRGLWSSS